MASHGHETGKKENVGNGPQLGEGDSLRRQGVVAVDLLEQHRSQGID